MDRKRQMSDIVPQVDPVDELVGWKGGGGASEWPCVVAYMRSIL